MLMGVRGASEGRDPVMASGTGRTTYGDERTNGGHERMQSEREWENRPQVSKSRHPERKSRGCGFFLEPMQATVGYNVFMYLGEP